MCPACWATVAMIAAGAGSATGLTALVARKLRGKRESKGPDFRVEAPKREETSR
ncbi:MAG TPA: hypothetical protein VKE69_02320 [Planctomycetota bacterium]|nr:hypothetical protein [Planctomycetota bacterium]